MDLRRLVCTDNYLILAELTLSNEKKIEIQRSLCRLRCSPKLGLAEILTEWIFRWALKCIAEASAQEGSAECIHSPWILAVKHPKFKVLNSQKS